MRKPSLCRRLQLAIVLLCASLAGAQATLTSVTGRIVKLDLTDITAGKVTFTLTPSRDSTISGLARFDPSQIVCPIASSPAGSRITSLVNSSVPTVVNPLSVGATSEVVSFATGFATGQAIAIEGGGTGGGIYIGTLTNVVGTTLTFTPSLPHGVSSGSVTYVPCQVTMNTSLTPTGSYYRVDLYPGFVRTSSFNFYAVASQYDWSTVVPTATTGPADNFVTTFGTQTIDGKKTFSSKQIFTDQVEVDGSDNTDSLTIQAVDDSGAHGSPRLKLCNLNTQCAQAKLSTNGSVTVWDLVDDSNNRLIRCLFGADLGCIFGQGLQVTGHVFAGTGMQHVRQAACTTGAGANAVCNTTVAWGTAFADTNYTASCTFNNTTTAGSTVTRYGTKLAGSIVVEITNGPGGGATTGTINCMAMHD